MNYKEMNPLEIFFFHLLKNELNLINKDEFLNIFNLIKLFLNQNEFFENILKYFEDKKLPIETILRINLIINLSKYYKELNFDFINLNNSSYFDQLSWTIEEDNKLLSLIYLYGLNNWVKISYFIGGKRNPAECSQRWFRILDPRTSSTNWSNEEDQKLFKLILKFGENWELISKKFINKNEKQCKNRFSKLRSEFKRFKKENELNNNFKIFISNSEPIIKLYQCY